jgi:hypothetical protein
MNSITDLDIFSNLFSPLRDIIADYILEDDPKLAVNTCNLDIIKWYQGIKKLDKYSYEDCIIDSTDSIAVENSLDFILWINDTFGLTRYEITRNENHIFKHLCSIKNFKLIKWLISKFKITKLDCMATNNEALIDACINGHLDVVKFIIEEFKFTKDDCMWINNLPFEYACENGHLDIIKWLHNKFTFTIEDLSPSDWLRRKIYNQNVIDWLDNTFDIKLNMLGM